jgi:hypothetical protein
VALLAQEETTADFRKVAVVLQSIDPAGAASGVATSIVLNGLSLVPGNVTVNGVTLPVTPTEAGLAFTTDSGIPAGTYDVIYAAADGQVSVLANGLILT